MKKATNIIIAEIFIHHAGGSLVNVCGWLLDHQYPIANNGMSRKNKYSIYFSSLSMVSLASPESAKVAIILWIISPMLMLYLLLIDFRCF